MLTYPADGQHAPSDRGITEDISYQPQRPPHALIPDKSPGSSQHRGMATAPDGEADRLKQLSPFRLRQRPGSDVQDR